jgi:hypothetical protein
MAPTGFRGYAGKRARQNKQFNPYKMRKNQRSWTALPPARYPSTQAKIWWALNLLATIALELVSCAEARVPIPRERLQAIRAFERDLDAQCSGDAGEGSLSHHFDQVSTGMTEYESYCAEVVE